MCKSGVMIMFRQYLGDNLILYTHAHTHTHTHTHRFSPFVKTGTEAFVLGKVSLKSQVTAADTIKIIVSAHNVFSNTMYMYMYMRVREGGGICSLISY